MANDPVNGVPVPHGSMLQPGQAPMQHVGGAQWDRKLVLRYAAIAVGVLAAVGLILGLALGASRGVFQQQ